MSEYVLDASALLAMLQNEPGAEFVQKKLQNSVISSVNFSETVSRLVRHGMPENEIQDLLNLLGLEIIPFFEEQAYQCGFMSSSTKSTGLSFADRACLALAQQLDRIALTADRAWMSLPIDIQVEMIRK
jgi:PIN domain nuclease of toxin-antitoxin system